MTRNAAQRAGNGCSTVPERRAPDSRVLAAAVEHDVAGVQNVPRRMREVEAWR
jgi:hypothetical protein